METSATAIDLGGIQLSAEISLPGRPRGLVLFAHGSGSGRHSPRNRHVATVLNQGGVATILTDLLTMEEEAADIRTTELRFDIPLLGERVAGITDWIVRQPRLGLPGLGYFGASTGAAAALVAAAARPALVKAIVSRGGRPDLAGSSLRGVLAPTLFIVGEDDTVVLDLNHQAMSQLPRQTEHKIEVIPGASHLFEEPGTLDRAARLAREWFCKYLSPVVA
jgi:dienelactone hydrolase